MIQLLAVKESCGRCGSGVPVWSDVCFECGLVLHPPGRLRAAGVLYLVIGLVLTAPITYLIVRIAGIMARSDDPGATTRFDGSAWDAAFVFAVLGFVLAIGVTGILMGVWQIRHGRRNLKLVRVVMVYFVVFWVGAILVQFFL